MREEETRGRLEPVLAGAVSRPRWMASYLVTTALGALALLLVFAAGMGITAGLALGDVPGLLREVTGAALAQLPAVLSVAAAVVVLFALVPRRAAVLSWLVLGAAILLSPMWGLSLGLPQWALDLSPFTYQKVPAQAVSTAAIVALIGIAAGLVAAGLTVFRRRDLVA
jgi:ABC-2 type transport system permease protein